MRDATATDIARPAIDPPPILPWNDFRTDEIKSTQQTVAVTNA